MQKKSFSINLQKEFFFNFLYKFYNPFILVLLSVSRITSCPRILSCSVTKHHYITKRSDASYKIPTSALEHTVHLKPYPTKPH